MTSSPEPLPDQPGVVLVTAPSEAEAKAIAHHLLFAKLAACVTILPVHSIYTWQGAVEQSDEWQLLVKTDLSQFETLAATVQEIHSYDVPEIIALPILAGSPAYLHWIAQQVSARSPD